MLTASRTDDDVGDDQGDDDNDDDGDNDDDDVFDYGRLLDASVDLQMQLYLKLSQVD